MAKASVEMTCPTCGKTYTWSTTKYNRKEADSWESWASGQERECPECYAETMRKQREAEAQEKMEKAKEGFLKIDLDTLNLGGSEKQNAWAKKILAELIATLEKMKPNDEGVRVIGGIIRSTTAREVIDNRNNMMGWLEKRVCKKTEETPVEAVETSAEGNTTPATEEAPAPAPKTEWRKVAINVQNICGETDRGICIQMPHSSNYDGYKFWTSKKLMREGRHSYEYLLSINDEMKFTLQKNGNGKYNRFKVIASQEITAEALAEAFGGYVEEPNAYREQADFEREEIVRHTPEPLAPVEIEADPELVR
jgi:endogenous inhibitor of DNA gyrase (YacG/DUF329 family)